MKKFLIICAILFIAGVGCKKMDIDGGEICACSPISEPPLFLVLKNSAGADLLDEKVQGAYVKDNITLFRKGADGKEIPVQFSLRPPLSFTATEKLEFNHLQIDVSFFRQLQNTAIYLRLGEGEPYELQPKINLETNKVDQLLINHKNADRDQTNIGKNFAIFYLTI